MTETRRTAVTLLTAGLAAGALASCGGRVNRRAAKLGLLNVETLSRGFPALAARAAPARFNLGVLSLTGDHVWQVDGEGLYPLADLFMLPVAAAALAEVDAGRLKLGEPITIRDVDLSPQPSLVGAAFAGETIMPAVDLIALAVQHGDNTAADVIMSRIGGPGAVAGWLQAKDIVGMRVDGYAREVATRMVGLPSFRAAWRTDSAFAAARAAVPPAAREAAVQAFLHDPRDTTTTPAALSFLNRLSDGQLLSPASTRLLIGLMTRSAGPPGGLASSLPAGVSLARKTAGSGGDLGLTAATNEIGLVTFKDGKRLAIAVFLAGSTATAAERQRLIADAGRLVFRAWG